MLRLGLTGGIASGKSAVATMLRELGFSVLDADSLAHKLIEPGQPAYEEVLREFGIAIADGQGRVDRAKLAALVFAERARLDRLNAIVHPRVAQAVSRRFEEWQREGTRDAAVVEAALLVEAGMHRQLDGLVVTWCRPVLPAHRPPAPCSPDCRPSPHALSAAPGGPARRAGALPGDAGGSAPPHHVLRRAQRASYRSAGVLRSQGHARRCAR